MTQPGTPEWTSNAGLTVRMVREAVLDGLPIVQSGLEVPEWLIQEALLSAENKVEGDLDVMVYQREVYCVEDQDDSGLDIDDNRVILPPIDKPRNWMAADRFGTIRLPKGPVKKLRRVTFRPYGPIVKPFDFPLEGAQQRIRLDGRKIRFVAGPNGYLAAYPNALTALMMQDGRAIPNGLEVVYLAGLSPRQLNGEARLIRMIILMQAAILTLGLVQGRVGAGLQKENLAQDGLVNGVEVAKRDVLGALGGEIKALKANYAELVKTAQADSTLAWVFLG